MRSPHWAQPSAPVTDLLIAELHRDVGPKAVRLGEVEQGQRHLEQARALFADLGDRVGEANVLRNLAHLPTVSWEDGVSLLRSAIELVDPDDAPQNFLVLKLDLAAFLTAYGDKPVDLACHVEAEQLVTEAWPIVVANGWTYMLPTAGSALSVAQLAQSRPREALDSAVAGRQFATSDPFDRSLAEMFVAEAALASGEVEVAAAACREFNELVALHGRDNLEAQLFKTRQGRDLFERMARVEEAAGGDQAGIS